MPWHPSASYLLPSQGVKGYGVAPANAPCHSGMFATP